jgi:phosphoadenosine phosphosulfate reductase
MSTTISTNIIEKTKDFQLKRSSAFGNEYKDKVVFSTLRQEDQVITALIANSNAAINILPDTGRCFKTYDVFIKH